MSVSTGGMGCGSPGTPLTSLVLSLRKMTALRKGHLAVDLSTQTVKLTRRMQHYKLSERVMPPSKRRRRKKNLRMQPLGRGKSQSQGLTLGIMALEPGPRVKECAELLL